MSAKPQVLPTPESIAKYVKENLRKAQKGSSKMAMMHHDGGREVVREDDYKGHRIVVRTTYDISVDGQPVTGHLVVNNAGQVQYHGLPNYSFDSAMGLVRALIDNFPEDFEKKKHSGHASGGSHKPMRGMNMKGMTPGKPAGKKKTKTKPRVTRSKSR